jgi:hypothetical protein
MDTRVSMPRQRFNFWIDDELRQGLKAVRDRDGIVESEQIRRAIREWLAQKGVRKKAVSRRASPRKRA